MFNHYPYTRNYMFKYFYLFGIHALCAYLSHRIFAIRFSVDFCEDQHEMQTKLRLRKRTRKKREREYANGSNDETLLSPGSDCFVMSHFIATTRKYAMGTVLERAISDHRNLPFHSIYIVYMMTTVVFCFCCLKSCRKNHTADQISAFYIDAGLHR